MSALWQKARKTARFLYRHSPFCPLATVRARRGGYHWSDYTGPDRVPVPDHVISWVLGDHGEPARENAPAGAGEAAGAEKVSAP